MNIARFRRVEDIERDAWERFKLRRDGDSRRYWLRAVDILKRLDTKADNWHRKTQKA